VVGVENYRCSHRQVLLQGIVLSQQLLLLQFTFASFALFTP
jgi:hypothetical protein